MPNTLTAALDDILAAARTVTGVSVYQADRTGTMRTPAVVVSLPIVRWQAFHMGPTSAEFRVMVVVSLDEYAMGRLMELVPVVREAITDNTPAGVVEATPVPFDAAAASLAAFELVTEYPLSGA